MPGGRTTMVVMAGLAGMGLARAMQRILTTPALHLTGPLTLNVLALLLTALGLSLFLLARGGLPQDRGLWLFALPLGLTNVAVPALAFTLGQQHLSTSAAGLFGAAIPVATALLATWFLGERLSWQGWTGMALAAGAVASLALASSGGSSALVGVLWSSLAVLSVGVAFVLMRRRRAQFALAPLLFAQLCWSALLLVPLAALEHPPGGAPVGQLSLLVVGLALSSMLLPQLLAVYLVRLAEASKVAASNYLVPLATAGLAWLLLAEPPSLHVLAAGAVAVAGAWMVNRDRGRQQPVVQLAPGAETAPRPPGLASRA